MKEGFGSRSYESIGGLNASQYGLVDTSVALSHGAAMIAMTDNVYPR